MKWQLGSVGPEGRWVPLLSRVHCCMELGFHWKQELEISVLTHSEIWRGRKIMPALSSFMSRCLPLSYLYFSKVPHKTSSAFTKDWNPSVLLKAAMGFVCTVIHLL